MKIKRLLILAMLFLCLTACNKTDGGKPNQPNIEDNVKDEIKDNVEEDNKKDDEVIEQAEMTLSEYSKKNIKGKYLVDNNFKSYLENLKEYNDLENVVANALYASPNGNGDGKSKTDPANIYDAIYDLKAGQTLYLLGGDYILGETLYIDAVGNENAYCRIRNYPGEKVNITSSQANINKYNEGGEYVLFAFEKTSKYVIIEGLEFSNITCNNAVGITFYDGGQNHIIIRNNKIHDLKTTNGANEEYGANAILLMGEHKTTPISNVVIYDNYIYDNKIGYSESISVAGNCEGIYVFKNTLINNTNISIDFYGNNSDGYCPTPSLNQPRYSMAIGNIVEKSKSEYADCAGIYVDGARDILISNNKVFDSQYGIEIGSEEKSVNYPVTNIDVFNNLIYDNQFCGIRIGGYDLKTSGVVKNVNVFNNTLKNNDTEIIINMVENIFIKQNVFKTNGIIMSSEDFNGQNIKNVVFENNLYNSSNNNSFEYYDKTVNFENKNITQSFELNSSYSYNLDLISEEILTEYNYSFNLRNSSNNYYGAI